MVSLKDIAAACGVSVATVSKALNDQRDIGAKTKEHIRQTARSMGYFPNYSARTLKTNRSYNIGVLFADASRSGLMHDFFSAILDSFKRTVEDRGYDITFVNASRGGEHRMSYYERCRNRCFDGVVIACVESRDNEVEELVNSNIPLVSIDRVFRNRTSIVSDNASGMRDLLKYIYRLGHRRIAYIHGADSAVTKARLEAFYDTTKKLGITNRPEYICEAEYRDTTAAEKLTCRLLALETPPTCILYPDDFTSFGGMNAIRQRGLSIPRDISIAGYDGLRLGRHLDPPLTTLVQDTERMGAAAGEKLLELIENPEEKHVERIIIPGSVYPGGSVGIIS